MEEPFARRFERQRRIVRPSVSPENDEDNSLFNNTSRQQLEKYFKVSLFTLGVLTFILILTMMKGGKGNVMVEICQTPDCIQSALILLNAMNTSADPCTNFYEYACGNWEPEYPSNYEDTAHCFQSWVTEQAAKQRNQLMEQLRRESFIYEPSAAKAARRVFRACQNMEAINAVGLAALQDVLRKLGLPQNPLEPTGEELPWIRVLGKLYRHLGYSPIIGVDLMPSTQNGPLTSFILFGPQDSSDDSIFGMRSPRRQITEKSTSRVNFRDWVFYAEKIISYVIRAGGNSVIDDKLRIMTDGIVKVFVVINQAMKKEDYWQRINSIVPDMMTTDNFQLLIHNQTSSGTSKIEFVSFFEEILFGSPELGENISTTILKIYRIRYYLALTQLLESIEERDLEYFIWWKVVFLLATHVNEDLINLKDKMVWSLSVGKRLKFSRETVCYLNVVQLMKPSVGYFILQASDASIINRVEIMASSVRKALFSNIDNQNWIDDKTRQFWVGKARALNIRVGFPETMTINSKFDEFYRSREENKEDGVKEGQIPLFQFQHLKNLQTLVNFAFMEKIKKLRTANDSNTEDFDPSLINTYYTLDTNSVVIPYSVLTLPIFGWSTEALNYGSMGSFLAHEMNHAFDTKGWRYDQTGRSSSYSRNQSSGKYSEISSCFIDQYDRFNLTYNNNMIKIDGKSTLQENIADNGGLKVAFDAFKNHTERTSDVQLPGFQQFTSEKMFFLSYARTKCSKYTKTGLSEASHEAHSPEFARLLITLQNSVEFSKAWNCPEGSLMNPRRKCQFWS